MRHFQLLSKCEGKQLEKLRITTGIRKSNKSKNELFSPASGKDINFTDMFFLQQRKAGERKEIYTERVGDGQKGGAGRGGTMSILLSFSRSLPAPFTLTLDQRRPVEQTIMSF